MRLPAVVVTSRRKRIPRLPAKDLCGLAKEGIASPDGDNHSDGEEAGDVSRGGAESGRPPMHAEVAASTCATAAATTPAAATPNHKSKEKVGASGGSVTFQILTDVPETPHDPASDLAPRACRGKHPAETTPDRAARPLSGHQGCADVFSSDEEGAGSQLSLKLLFKRMLARIMLRGLMLRCPPPPPEEVDE
ncbi:hypothetical protein LWI29_008757 [Acer saccharum]|uniref:Uncharacterized protein n=1 Tax=Acer saccharum TaxID=4024 RepID=A0AA39SNJ3_ACESA|nr:hypothetical protein LWI29_008757 [Acer saccharum]